MDRREFLFSAGAVTLIAGCRTSEIFGSPEMRFGVVSDIHVTTPKTACLFEQALRYFKRRGVDAVVVPGDLTDWGLRSGFRYVKAAWDRVFAGTDVVPLFCTGNHDFEGWRYWDMAMEMHANGYTEDDAMVRTGGMAPYWKKAFGEAYANVRCRTVKGYEFVSGEYQGFEDLAGWMAVNGKRLEGSRPFFYFQHLPIRGTTSDSFGWADDGKIKPVLSKYPNCIAFTGHSHKPFIDERLIWQGEFTCVATPSLSYASAPGEYENGAGPRSGKFGPRADGTVPPIQAMQVVPTRLDLRGGQGYVVNVWNDKVVIERWDLEELESDAPAWVIPLPACKAAKPYDNAVREKTEPVPCFPRGAQLDLETRNTENRSGKWTIVMNCEFPSAVVPKGSRVYDYEIRAVPKDGSPALVRRFLSPAFAKMAKFEPSRQRFWFDVAELPQDKDYVIEVYARNCFGKAGAPLVSGVFHGKPGLEKVKR